MDFTQYIKPELLVLIVVLYVIGLVLKNTQVKNKWIPLILLGAGIVLAVVWVVSTEPITGAQEAAGAVFTALVQGVLCAGAAVFSNQLVKQAGKTE